MIEFFKQTHACRYSEVVSVQEFGGHWEYCVRCDKPTIIVLDHDYEYDDILPIEITTWILQAILGKKPRP